MLISVSSDRVQLRDRLLRRRLKDICYREKFSFKAYAFSTTIAHRQDWVGYGMLVLQNKLELQ